MYGLLGIVVDVHIDEICCIIWFTRSNMSFTKDFTGFYNLYDL